MDLLALLPTLADEANEIIWIFGAYLDEMHDYPELDEIMKPDRKKVVVAAGSGLEVLFDNDFAAAVFVGDLDGNMSPETKEILRENIGDSNYSVILPENKDETDTFAAAKHIIGVLQNDLSPLVIYGGVGGDFGHTFANIQMLKYIAEQKYFGVLRGGATILAAIPPKGKYHSIRFAPPVGSYFSIFAMTNTAKVTVRGSEYDGDNITLSSNFPKGARNKTKLKQVNITVTSGIVLLSYTDPRDVDF
ncbi:MAG: hypothetical protein LBN42_02150 [Oscillospiraceae bacterium]|jgi:thiamine pyrophosphokinase|nr:hypothetical protein [Oscillospiraceae bacterium]